MKKTIGKRAATVLLSCALLLSALPAGASENVTLVSNTGFPDVERGVWYEEALLKMQNYTPGIIDGSTDSDGVKRFHPNNPVKRGEFLKMSMTAAEGFTADESRNDVHWAGEYYTIALENNVLIADAYTGKEPIFPCTYDALEAPINRYEMAVILSNACTNMQMEPNVVINNAAGNIPDYTQISEYTPDINTVNKGSYVNAVEQSYGRGLLTGYSDGSFQGENTLNRGEAAVVIYRQLNWKDSRQKPNWASEAVLGSSATSIDPGKSFAFWLQDGHLNGSTPDAEARQLLFGNANKSYFSSSAEASPYMENVSFPIWAIDKTGNKYSTTGSLTVNKMVANEVQLIFEQIYNDPERYPIYGYSIGGARFSDTMRHSWGCAIDINPYFNCECNFRAGYQIVTCGYGWWPAGMDGATWVNRSSAVYHGSLTEPSPYSIGPNSSVVRAFANYGWGWGGSGSNVIGVQKGWSSGNNFDFMHFSVLPSGG